MILVSLQGASLDTQGASREHPWRVLGSSLGSSLEAAWKGPWRFPGKSLEAPWRLPPRKSTQFYIDSVEPKLRLRFSSGSC